MIVPSISVDPMRTLSGIPKASQALPLKGPPPHLFTSTDTTCQPGGAVIVQTPILPSLPHPLLHLIQCLMDLMLPSIRTTFPPC